MSRTPRIKAALGLALLSAVVPAAAQAQAPAHVPVPAGQLQHTVTDLTFPAAKNTFHHDALRNERWIGATAGRDVVTNVSTGKVREDCQYTLTEARCGPRLPALVAGRRRQRLDRKWRAATRTAEAQELAPRGDRVRRHRLGAGARPLRLMSVTTRRG